MIQMQTLHCNGDQAVGEDGNPNFPLHPVPTDAKEDVDLQMLLDPLEQQLHAPALVTKVSNQLQPQSNVVDPKNRASSGIALKHPLTGRGGVLKGLQSAASRVCDYQVLRAFRDLLGTGRAKERRPLLYSVRSKRPRSHVVAAGLQQ